MEIVIDNLDGWTDVANTVLSSLLGRDMSCTVERAYSGFELPLLQLDDNFYLVELEGDTGSFHDIAAKLFVQEYQIQGTIFSACPHIAVALSALLPQNTIKYLYTQDRPSDIQVLQLLTADNIATGCVSSTYDCILDIYRDNGIAIVDEQDIFVLAHVVWFVYCYLSVAENCRETVVLFVPEYSTICQRAGRYAQQIVNIQLVVGEYRDEQHTLECIEEFYDEYGVVPSPECALSYGAYKQYQEQRRDNYKKIVCSTQSPYKHVEKVLTALGQQCSVHASHNVKRLHSVTALPIPECFVEATRATPKQETYLSQDKIATWALENN